MQVLHDALIRERRILAAGDNDVILDWNTHDLACLDELARNPYVFPTRFRISGGMVVQTDDTRSIAQNRPLKYSPRFHDTGSESTLTEGHVVDDDIRRIQKHDLENLALEITHERTVHGGYIAGRGYLNSLTLPLGFHPAADFERRRETHGLGFTNPSNAHPLLHLPPGEGVK